MKHLFKNKRKKENIEIIELPIKCGNKKCSLVFHASYSKGLLEKKGLEMEYFNCINCNTKNKIKVSSAIMYEKKAILWNAIVEFNKNKQDEITKIWKKYGGNQFSNDVLKKYYNNQFEDLNHIKENLDSEKKIEMMMSKDIIQEELDFLNGEVAAKKNELKDIKATLRKVKKNLK